MNKYKLYMIETLYHIVDVDAKNEEEVRKIFNDNKIDWAAAECYDATVSIDNIMEV